MSTVKDLTVAELRQLIGDMVDERLQELLGDPDSGLSLRPEIRRRLEQELRDERPDANVSAAETARRLGLEW